MYKVLLIDDEILVREAIAKRMKWAELGFELVASCENGKEAVEYIRQNQVDIVLTDICMPHMDGMDLSRWLYENFPEIKIIIFSGFSDFEYAKKAIRYRVSEYLLKPVTSKELTEVLLKIKEKLDALKQENLKKEVLYSKYKTYRKKEKVILSNAIFQLVMGTQDIRDSLEEMKALGICLSSSCYRIVMLDVDDYSNFSEVNEKTKKEIALMSFIVANISEEIVNEKNNGFCFQDSKNKVYLLLQTNKPKEFLEVSKKLCLRIQRLVKELVKVDLTVGMGLYVNRVEDFYLSYQSAKKAVDYRYLLGRRTLVDMELEKDRLDLPIDYSKERQTLLEGIRYEEWEKIDFFMDFIREKLKESMLSKSRAVIYLQEILRDIEENAGRTEEDRSEKGQKILRISEQLADAESLKQALDILSSYAKDLSRSLLYFKQNANERQARKALDYIEQNFSDKSLSLHTICHYLGISTSHFSSLFKEATGETFVEALVRIRMNKAKELLKESNLKNYEIAERVGFSDPHYFSISFKKMTGKTPTEYAREKKIR